MRRRHVPQRKKIIQRHFIDLPADLRVLEQAVHFRAEDNSLANKAIVERFLTDSVSRKEKSLLASIPDGEREHPVQTTQTFGSMFLVEMNNRLGIRLRGELVSSFNQGFAQFQVVINFA